MEVIRWHTNAHLSTTRTWEWQAFRGHVVVPAGPPFLPLHGSLEKVAGTAAPNAGVHRSRAFVHLVANDPHEELMVVYFSFRPSIAHLSSDV